MEENTADLLNVNVMIADRPYPLKIDRGDEETVRKAAKMVNQKMADYQKLYAAKDKQDYLAMSALMFAVDALKSENRIQIEDTAFPDKLNTLDNLISRALAD